jgi:hypothetical protein
MSLSIEGNERDVMDRLDTIEKWLDKLEAQQTEFRSYNAEWRERITEIQNTSSTLKLALDGVRVRAETFANYISLVEINNDGEPSLWQSTYNLARIFPLLTRVSLPEFISYFYSPSRVQPSALDV